jgi:methylenetetrahydrofolate reductase (NADPH)
MINPEATSGMAEILRGYSIEVNPSDPKVVEAAISRLDSGTQIFLTWVPGADPMNMVGPAARLRRAGMFPVPHICARHFISAGQLELLAARLVGEAGVDRILIVGGDRHEPAGPYDSALAVMQTEIFQKAGVTRFAVAGFPEGNPNVSDDILDQALAAKLTFARATGLQLSIVTQFAFEAEPIVEWLKHIHAHAIDVSVRIGLAGPAGLITLTRYAIRCGIGNSLHALTQHPSFARLLAEKGPEPIIRNLAATEGQGSRLPEGVDGLHFFVFGGFNKTLDWINAQREK